MSIVKALIVGISKYEGNTFSNLPYCKNDIYLMKNALTDGLNIEEENITLCGELDIVMLDDFRKILTSTFDSLDVEDTFILYFSGHGDIRDDDTHFLAFSDKLLVTQDLIDDLQEIKCKSKILFLDCCFAGSFDSPYLPPLDIDKTLGEFIGTGCAVLASSNPIEKSHFTADGVSIFTKYLSEAITSKLITREGQKSLYDIQRLVFQLLDIFNRKNLDIQQHPIFRAGLYGMITFKVSAYEPYIQKDFYFEHDDYIIHSVKPMHHGLAKRYSVTCILRELCDWDRITNITLEIKDKLMFCDIYANNISERKYKRKPTNIIWVYFGYDNHDLINNNYICHTTWVDDTMDKGGRYKGGKLQFNQNDVNVLIHDNYDYLKKFTNQNTGKESLLYQAMNSIVSRMIEQSEEYLSHYREFCNEEITEDQLVEYAKSNIEKLNELDFKSTELLFVPPSIHDWYQFCQHLIATIQNLIYAYKSDTIYDTIDKRKRYMDTYVKIYYRELEKFKDFEN